MEPAPRLVPNPSTMTRVAGDQEGPIAGEGRAGAGGPAAGRTRNHETEGAYRAPVTAVETFMSNYGHVLVALAQDPTRACAT